MRHTVTIHCISMWALSFTHALSSNRQLRALRLRPLSQLYFLLRHASAHPGRLFSQRRIRTLHLPHRTRTSTAQREREGEREGETLAPIQAAASFTCASTGVAASLLRHASAPHPPPPLLSARVVQGSSVVSRASGRARIRPERERQREKRER